MVRALIATFALFMASANAPAKSTQPSTPKLRTTSLSVPSPLNSSPAEDRHAELHLLDLANLARQQAGVGRLQEDGGLTQAALAHAQAMAASQQLSHQFSGEPALAERLAITTNLHLDRAGENVAYAATIDRVQAVLMASLPHRENLLNPVFNVAGFAVVRSGETLYVTEDFGHRLPTYSAQASAAMLSNSLNQVRQQKGLGTLEMLSAAGAQSSACAMANAGSIDIPVPRASYVIRYTTIEPQSLPASAMKALLDPGVHGYSVGSCYGRSSGYPNGAYWMVLLLY